ncbi:hypothetical protein BKA57DRAFT_489846 [Linnemannia elongata]|nr:hypothetical protein BKA57DRAFT_489846 [Linnemannia elongata]
MMTLLANYSFNDRPIYLLEAEASGYNIANIATYMRANGCKAITLVAGGNKGLYPFKYNSKVLAFKDLGLDTSYNITIQWPKSQIRKGAAPLATLIKQDVSGDDTGYIQIQQDAIHRSSYKHDHVLLEEHTEYSIVTVALEEYYGNMTYFATLSNGMRIRCGKALDAMVDKWLRRHPSGKAPYLTFTTGYKRTVKGYKDIQVRRST